MGGSSRETATLPPKPSTLMCLYGLLTGKFWDHFTGPCLDLSHV